MKNQRRVGELITICCGIGLVIGGYLVNVPLVAYGDLHYGTWSNFCILEIEWFIVTTFASQ